MPRPLKKPRWSASASIFQVADITTSFLTGPISLDPILMLETGNLSCADLHRHVAVHPLSFHFRSYSNNMQLTRSRTFSTHKLISSISFVACLLSWKWPLAVRCQSARDV
jgi:hypothetical protein